MKFVIQEYRLSNGGIRYYLRLEKDGVLKGWAVPKGLPEKGERQRLALEVGPYKLSAAGFEGKVAKSKFGPGMMSVWDQGEYRLDSWLDNRIIFELFGSRVKGLFALVRFTKAGSLHWLLSRPHTSPSTPQSKPAVKKPDKSPAVPPSRRAPARRPTVGTKKASVKKPPPSNRSKSISSQSKSKPNRRPIQRPVKKPKSAKSKAPRKRPKKYKSHYRRKRKTANWLNKNSHNRDGRMVGWIIMGAIIMFIYGLVKAIQYIGSLK